MDIDVQTTSEGPCVRLAGELTIYTVAEIKAPLLAATAQASVELDLSQVTEIDCAGLQLLMLLKREAKAAARVLRLARHSPVVLDTFDTLNLAGWFGDPLVLPAGAPAREGAST